jgi:hypothetical protein
MKKENRVLRGSNCMRGSLTKLYSEFKNPIEYYLRIGEEKIFLNSLIGKKISFSYTGVICCIQCGRKTKKSFQQGYCFPCLQRLQECNMCMIHPERCQVMNEISCPKDDWAHQHCHHHHIVYLANSSDLKVGITRESQLPTRWIDQGAMQALPIFRVSNRYLAGVIEVAFKSFVSDRTDWRCMLKKDSQKMDLFKERDRLYAEAKAALDAVTQPFQTSDISFLQDEQAIDLVYPISQSQYPQKISNLSFDKTQQIAGELIGIKGQYLILSTGVINIRKFGGYEVEFQMVDDF